MNELNTPRIPALAGFLKRCSTLFKMVGVALLIALLLIPLGMIRSVLQERLERRNEAVADITSKWGRDQSLVGPVLVVPYRHPVKSWRDKPTPHGGYERVEVTEMMLAHACFLPAKLAVNGTVSPKYLRRGIYQAVVYTGALDIAAEFARPDFAGLRIDERNVLWDEAVVTFAIPDLRGVKETLQLQWGDKSVALWPGCKLKGFPTGVFAGINGLRDGAGAIPARLQLSLNGSGGVNFVPIGAQTTVRLSSSWPDPSFQGAFLPTDRKVTPAGFEATWQISYYGRDYAQQWTDQDPTGGLDANAAASSWFGVNFLAGLDAYRNAERAIKYGILFLGLVFTAFFLFEILSGLRIHPFQYALVGGALCLFYLGLLSLSEFIPFGLSYLAAAAATTLLIWFYCAKVLRSGRRTLIVVGLLAGIYGFLYVALQLQDYSLLFGTAGLFAVLAGVIYLTRNIDWYARDQSQPCHV
jgi:inner membrane protein